MLKKYLDKLGASEYDSYLEAKNENIIVKEGLSKGYAYYVKKNPDSYGIRVSALSEDDADPKELLKEVIDYLNGKVYFLINHENRQLEKFLVKHGYDYWYGTYELEFSGQIDHVDDLHFESYTDEDFDRFIEILGPAFADVRRDCQLEPHDWFSNNKEQARKDFKANIEKNEIFKLIVDDKIIGVSIIEDHYIDMLCVDKAYQGRGYGKKMLRYWMKYLIDKGYKTIVLGMLASNEKALKLYTDQGFSIRAGVKILQNDKEMN